MTTTERRIEPALDWKPGDGEYGDIRYETARGHRQDHDQPARGAQRLPAPDRGRAARTPSTGPATTPRSGVIILTGEGPLAFCSGGDQKVRGDDGYIDDHGVGRLNVLDLQIQIRRLPKPVIAMVAGLRHRRRPRAAPGVRPHHRRRQRPLRPDRAPGRLLRRRLRRRACWPAPSARRRPRRSGSSASSTTPQAALDMGLVNTVVPLDRAGGRDGRLVPQDPPATARWRCACSRPLTRPTPTAWPASSSWPATPPSSTTCPRRPRRAAAPTSRSARPTSAASPSGP